MPITKPHLPSGERHPDKPTSQGEAEGKELSTVRIYPKVPKPEVTH